MSIKRMKTLTVGETTYQVVDSTVPDWAREPTKPTDFANGGTMDGSLVINGDLTVNGTSTTIETFNENVNVEDNTITLRHNATTGLQNEDYTGIIAHNYDGTTDGMLVFDNNGTAYVGDAGDLQPLATRSLFSEDNGELVSWDAANQTLIKAPVKVENIVTKDNFDSLNTVLSTNTNNAEMSYVKDVPTDSANYAAVNKIGGMTRKCANLFDVSKAQIGYRCSVGGALTKNSSYASSDYIEVKGGTSYYLTNVCGNAYVSAVLFDASKAAVDTAVVGNGANVSGVINVGSDAKYIRINIFTDAVDINTVMVNEGTTALPYEPYFEGLRSVRVTEVERVGVNLFNSAETRDGYYDVTNNGTFVASEWKASPFIPCSPLTPYTVSNAAFTTFGYWNFYDVNKNQIGYEEMYNNTTVTTPNGCCYLTFYARFTGDVMLNSGSTPLPYRSYLHHTLPIPVEVRGSENLIPFPYIWGASTTQDGITLVANADGSIAISGTATDHTWTECAKIPLEATTYTARLANTPSGYNVYLIRPTSDADDIKLTESAQTFKAVKGTYTLVIQCVSGYSFNTVTHIMLNEGTTALPYEPYGIAGLDGYGLSVNESVYNYIDWEKKQFVKRVDKRDMGTLEWSYGSGLFASRDLRGIIKKAKDNSAVANILTSKYQITSRTGVDTMGKSICCDPDGDLDVNDSAYTDPATFKQAMSGVMLVYELAEPEVTDISDILLTDNFIGVEGNGTLTFKNEYEYAIPSEVVFYNEKAEAIAADRIVGNLIGVATRAISDEDGNSITGTYIKKSNAFEVISDASGASIKVGNAVVSEAQLQKLIAFIDSVELS